MVGKEFRNFKGDRYQNKEGDGKYYITGAGKMDKYLTRKFGEPDTVLRTSGQIPPYVNTLLNGQIAIFATKTDGHGHTGVLKGNYHDPYVDGYVPVDVWKLAP